ncbi:MAG TPA: helix-turn-helix domain-containing protein [Thermoanaerobaculia bacterium]
MKNPTPEQHPWPCVMLKSLRERLGWTQARLVRKTGINKSNLSDYETKKVPPPDRLALLLDALDFGPRAVDLLVQAGERTEPPVLTQPTPVDPTPEQLRFIRDVAAEAAVCRFALLDEQLLRFARLWRAAEDRRQAVGLCDKLLAAEPEDRLATLEAVSELHTWACAERLAELSSIAAADSADTALELAGLAVRAAELAPDGGLFRARTHGFCLHFLANAQRVAGQLQVAEETFARGVERWEEGAAADPGLFAASRPLDLLASLRIEQQRFAEAQDLLARARDAAPEEVRGRILLKEASVLQESGDAEGALKLLRNGKQVLTAQGDARLHFGARFTEASALCDLERYAEAERLLPGVWDLAESLGNELDLVRTHWLQGLCWAGLGQTELARKAFEQVRETFTKRTIPYDCALVSLDLARLLLGQGRAAEVRRLAREMLWIFKSQAMPKHALAVLGVFRRAAEQEAATVELTRKVQRFLEKARNRPELRFEG